MCNLRHGYYGSPTYKVWAGMKYRCEHGIGAYKNVSVCKRWEKFENFLEDMGERPNNASIDRINVYGDYEPNNCRWANWEIQANNRTTNKYYLIDGEKMTLAQIARKYNVSRSNLANKIYLYKWGIKEALDYLIKKKEGVCHSTEKNV